MSQSEIVPVELGDRSYDIIIGAGELAQLGARLEQIGLSKKIAIITDENVHAHYGDRIKSALSGFETHMIVRPAGEDQKSMAGLEAVLDSLFQAGLDRSDTILAFGGGVMGDLAGFAASIYKRGTPFVQVPTTLLAQVDSSVGGKTAINNAYGKNLIGAFYQPRLVLIDTDLIGTLPKRQVQAGYAEIVKYGLIDQPDFFEILDAGLGDAILNLDPEALRQAIARSCQAKASVVAQDEREGGVRALLNLGHTFAHALELSAGYEGDLLHGEAVSAGLEMAYEFSARLGHCARADADRVSDHLKRLGMPTKATVGQWLRDPEALLTHMRQDKKNVGGQITLILTRGIGQSYIDRDTPADDLLAYLQDITM